MGSPVANIGGSPVFASQTSQGASTGSSAIAKIKEMAGKMLKSQGNEEQKQTPAMASKPSLVGGDGPQPVPMPALRERINIGEIIAQMIRAQRGF